MRGAIGLLFSAWLLVACGSEVEPNPPGMVAPKLATFPGQSGSCEVSYPPTTRSTTYTWDADARRLESVERSGGQQFAQAYWLFDEQGRVIEKGGDAQSHQQMRYDEQGTLIEFVQLLEGVESPDSSFDQQNLYDAEGRLLSAVMNYRSGTLRETRNYVYVGDELERITRVQEFAQGGLIEGAERYVRTRGRVTSAFYGSVSQPFQSETASYDPDGRLVAIEIDRGVDGKIDLRQSWGYRPDGTVRVVQEDGAAPVLDPPLPPPADGVPDQTLSFPASCAAIAMNPVEIYRFPGWAWAFRAKPASD